MGWVILVVGLLFLLAGLVISVWEAFRDICQRVPGAAARVQEGDLAGALDRLTEALARLLEAFAKLTVGIQLSLIGMVLIYCGLRVLGMLPA
jgi:uncharacterized membrane protein